MPTAMRVDDFTKSGASTWCSGFLVLYQILNLSVMKNCFMLLSFVLVTAVAQAQSKPVKIVFDITSRDTLTHQTVVRHVAGMAKAYPDSQFEVVVYGGALPMLIADQSSVADDIRQLEGKSNVTFMVCNQTMQRYGVDKSQLLNNVTVVPDAIIQIVMRQGEGWGYIKESHN